MNKQEAHEVGIWKRDGSTIYVLHEREDGTVCNRFWMQVHPDYGSGMTNNDSEAMASRIVSGLSQDDLKAVKSAIRHKIDEISNSPDSYIGVEYNAGSVKAYCDAMMMINEVLI